MTDITPDQLRAYGDEAEAIGDRPMPNATRPGRARAKVLSVRLNPDEFDELTHLADELELPASTLVRSWILTHLKADADASPAATVDRIARDVEQLRRQLVSIPPQTSQST
ncbi:MAG: hypothetical protein ACRDRG_20270 [Pseudonocardiaceae bacterium]